MAITSDQAAAVNPTPPNGKETPNPNPQSKNEYPKNFAVVTQCGHAYELNGSKGGERIRLLHCSGHFIDMDEKGDIYLIANQNIHAQAPGNMTVKVGDDVKKDKLVVHVIGNAHFQVEGDMHTEVWGDRYDKVDGKWEVKADSLFLQASNNMAIAADNNLKMDAPNVSTKMSFGENDLEEGGEIIDTIKGNRVIEMTKPGGVFAIRSEGDLQILTKGCRYDKVERNFFTYVDGKMKTSVAGEDVDCEDNADDNTSGAWTEKPEDSPYGNPTSWEVSAAESTRISSKDLHLTAEENMKIEAAGDKIEVVCDNGIYLN